VIDRLPGMKITPPAPPDSLPPSIVKLPPCCTKMSRPAQNYRHLSPLIVGKDDIIERHIRADREDFERVNEIAANEQTAPKPAATPSVLYYSPTAAMFWMVRFSTVTFPA